MKAAAVCIEMVEELLGSDVHVERAGMAEVMMPYFAVANSTAL